LKWYTRETGSIACSYGYPVHFGINRAGLVNAYASDVACLPLWQKRLWSAHNVSPDSAVSSELLQAQMRAQPARTQAAEEALPYMMEVLDELCERWAGGPLFQPHAATGSILRSVHRFRATNEQGLLALAKDITRVAVDRIETKWLQTIAPPGKDQWRSIKSLEMALATIVPHDEARSMLSPLVGVYQLRLGDAHLPSSEIEQAFALIGLDRAAPTIIQGQRMLEAVCNVLVGVARTIDARGAQAADQ
jgi:hypothetical protein